MNKKVLVCDVIARDAIEIMESNNLIVELKLDQSEKDLIAIVADYQAVIVRSATEITSKIIEAAKNLKVIARGGVGLDNVDVKAAVAKGIKVVNTPSASTNTVAELVIGMIFAAARYIPQADASMKSGRWEKNNFEGTEISGKTLGIIGAGRIGTCAAEKAIALGMQVMAVDPSIKLHPNPAIRIVSMDELLAQANYISLHVPYERSFGPLITAKEFAKMKKGVVLINASRGKVVSETALIEALKENVVACAVIDVWEREPTDNTALVAMKQVIALPHLGAASKEAQQRIGLEMAMKIVELLS